MPRRYQPNVHTVVGRGFWWTVHRVAGDPKEVENSFLATIVSPIVGPEHHGPYTPQNIMVLYPHTKNNTIAILHYMLVAIYLVPVSYCSRCPGPTCPVSTSVSSRASKNTKTPRSSHFHCKNQEKQQEISACHPSPLSAELEVSFGGRLKVERTEEERERIGSTQSSSSSVYTYTYS